MCRVCLFFVGCSLLVGCGGTTQPVVVEYDSGRDRTTYRSEPIPVRIETRGTYGSQFEQLRMDLRAVCTGRDCQPDQVQLTLSTVGSSELYIGDRTFAITADGEEFTWKDPFADRRRNQPEEVVGTVLQVSMAIRRLRKIANADNAEGRIGTITLDMEGRCQEQIRTFLTEMGRSQEQVRASLTEGERSTEPS